MQPLYLKEHQILARQVSSVQMAFPGTSPKKKKKKNKSSRDYVELSLSDRTSGQKWDFSCPLKNMEEEGKVYSRIGEIINKDKKGEKYKMHLVK